MGDHFQKLAAPEVARSEATAVAARSRMWLQEVGIIHSELSDCVLGSLGGGYAPGLGWRKAVASGHDTSDGHLELVTNGVEIIDTPTVYWTIDPDPFEAICPRCGVRCDSAFADSHILLHVDAWLQDDDTIAVCCPHCAGTAKLLAWRVNKIALAHFGLVFWNWPPIGDHLLVALARQAGSEIITLSGKL